MSHETYTKWWVVAKNRYEHLVPQDQNVMKKNTTIRDRNLANLLLGGLYAKYCVSVQQIATCLDQLAHPQQRLTIQKLYDAATIRLHELNEELKRIDLSEYHYIDGSLIELKLIPKDIEVLTDFYPATGRPQNIQKLYEQIQNGETRIYIPAILDLEQQQNVDEPKPEGDEAEIREKAKKKKRPKKFDSPGAVVPDLSQEEKEEQEKRAKLSEAVKIIQVHERARQSRLYFMETGDLAAVRRKLLRGEFLAKDPVQISEERREEAAKMIQKCWQRYAVRKREKCRLAEKRDLIGMTEKSWKCSREQDVYQCNLERRRRFRDQRIQEYIQANIDERIRVFRVIGPRLMEDIGDEIREWFHDWYTKVKVFDKYPPEGKGGTILVVRGETLTPYQWLNEVEKRRKQKQKNKTADKAKLAQEKKKKLEAAKKAKQKEKEKLKKELAKKKKRLRNFQDFEFEFEPNTALELFHRGIEEHRRKWDQRPDDPEERHIMEWITDEKCYELQLEVRVQVDEMMRLELELLEDALRKDRKKKGKKKKKSKKKKKGRRKKKGKKDPTGNRTYEDLVQELVDCGIIHSYEKRQLREYKGDLSYSNWEKRNLRFNPPSTLGDVRQVVKMNCVLPMTVESIKKPRSVLLVGCRQSGKKLLANAIFTETQCVLFDLSPENTAGKYPGKKGMKMLVHLIQKLSKALQPSIIYLNAAEKVFYKKVPKDEKHLEPKRFQKNLFKALVKTIQPQDRVMVLGITGRPWLAKQGKMLKSFERIVLIPRPDYGSIFLYWRELLMSYHGVDRNFEVSPLTLNTLNFPLSAIRQTVDTIFTPQRIISLNYKPLMHMELFEMLKTISTPISDKEFKKFQKWYNRTPWGKLMVLYQKFADKIREQERAALEKGKAKAASQKK